MIPTLHEFQVGLCHRTRAARVKGARVIVVQGTTGSGKTTVGCQFVKQSIEKNARSLWMVHRRRLVDQASGRLHEFEIDHGIMMSGEKFDLRYKVQVASRDTLLSRCVNNQWLGMPPADLVVVDEGHHAADPQSEYRRILNYYSQATILLLTATPVGPDGKGMGPWAQAIECAAPTSWLVANKYLVPVKCYAPERKTHRNGRVRRGIAGDLVESWKQYAENLPTVLFCSRVQHSIDAVEAFRAADIPAAHVDADTPDEERDRLFAGLETGAVKVVSNVGIIKEGVDIPCLGCCQFYMDPSGRVGFLQGCGRIMRPFPGKTHGVLIDHAGAVFRHGFPDEDTEWTLEGNIDENFKKKKDDGLTEKAHYCKKCELIYHGNPTCPHCGRQPVKPPRSIFAPPPVDSTNEVLTEAARGGAKTAWDKDEKVQHWLRCLAVAANKNGSFGMAAQIYKRKYSEWPGNDFPCVCARYEWKLKVADKYPKFVRKAKSQ